MQKKKTQKEQKIIKRHMRERESTRNEQDKRPEKALCKEREGEN